MDFSKAQMINNVVQISMQANTKDKTYQPTNRAA